MKFPFDFSITLVFRLVFPGIVLATATLPLLLGFFSWVGLAGDGKVTVTVLVPIAAVIFGWLIVLCDAPITCFWKDAPIRQPGFCPGCRTVKPAGSSASKADMRNLPTREIQARCRNQREKAGLSHR